MISYFCRDSVSIHRRGQSLSLDGEFNNLNLTSTQNVQNESNDSADSPERNQNSYSFISDVSKPNSFISNDTFLEDHEVSKSSDSFSSLFPKSPVSTTF